MFGNLVFTVAGWSSSVARWAHNPEVAGSNPVPATSGNDPRGATSGVIFMLDGHVIGHIRLLITRSAFLGGVLAWIQGAADEECGRLFRGVAVVVAQNMCVCLQEERDVRVSDPFTDDFGVEAGSECCGRVGVP